MHGFRPVFTDQPLIAAAPATWFLTTIPMVEFAITMQTQAQMTRSAIADFAKADRELNRVYKVLTGRLDSTSRQKLVKAQRAWLAFRDADAALAGDIEARGGSMEPMLVAFRKQELTEARTRDLRQMIS